MNGFERHDLTHLSLAGRERIFLELIGLGHQERAVGEILLPERFPNERGIMAAVPGIVRREEFAPRPGFLPVGFAAWRSGESGRLRVASFALPEEIVAKTNPEEVAAKIPDAPGRTPALNALRYLRNSRRFPALRLGVWGSVAMEIETGHPYTHEWSDLDIRLLPTGPADRETLARCLDAVLDAERAFGIRIDAELRLPGEYGISLKEFLNEGATVLGKGRADVVLLRKPDVFAGLGGCSAAPASIETCSVRSCHG